MTIKASVSDITIEEKKCLRDKGIVPTYRRLANGMWRGVLKNTSGEVLAECVRGHKCRDYNHSRLFGPSGAAMYCAKASAIAYIEAR